jgi:protein-disulfide isomerase
LALTLAACGPQQPAAPAGQDGTAAPTAGTAASDAATPAAGSPVAEGPTPTINPTSEAIAKTFQVPIRGSENAAVRIYEFSDYLCPFCGRFARETAAEIRAKYNEDQVAFVHWDFPLQSHGIMAMVAAEASHCAGQQREGAYWTMNDILFEKQIPAESLQPDDQDGAVAKAVSLAEEAGLDGAAMKACLDSQVYRPIVAALQGQAMERQVEMTPTLVLVSRNPTTGVYGDPETILGVVPMSEFDPYIQRSLSRSMGTAVPTPTPPPTPVPPTATP